MIVAKRIALLMATSAIAATLSGCEALDFLDFRGTGKDIEDSAAATESSTLQTSTASTAQAPAPFDLSAAQPMLPASTMNTQSSAANAALIGSTMGAAPSGFGAPSGLSGLTPGVPTTTTTTSTYSYGAQPNPYAPRVLTNTAPQVSPLAYQQAVSAGTVGTSPVAASSLYGQSYQPTVQPNAAVNTANTILRAPTAAPLTAGLPSSAVNAINTSSASNPAQPGTLDPANLSKSTITAIQTALKSRGLYSDVVDGVWGSNSKAAMNAYLATRGESAVSLDTLFSLGVSL